MKKIISILFLIVAFNLSSQDIEFKQIVKAGSAGQVIVTTGTNGVQSYTNVFPSSAIPSLSYIPTSSVSAFQPTITGGYLTPTSTSTLTNKSGNISQWTNDVGYVTSTIVAGYEPKLNGTGFVKSTGTVTSYDNTSYIPTSSVSAFQPTGTTWGLSGNTLGNNTSFLGSTDNRSLVLKTNNLQRLKIDSTGLVEITRTITPSQIAFAANSTLVKCAFGMIGTPEANMTFNMDYSTRKHRYYDTTVASGWFTLGPDFLGLQYVPAGYGNTTQPSDMWNRSGNVVPWWVEPSTGNMKINGTLKIGSLNKGQNTTTTTAIYARNMITPNGIDYISTPTVTSGNVTGFSQSITANTSGTVYGSVITLTNTGAGVVYANYASNGMNYFGGNTGIGAAASTPSVMLDINQASAGSGYRPGAQVGVQNNGRVIVSLISPAANDSYLMFGYPGVTNAGYLGYANTANLLTLHSSGTILLDQPTSVGGSLTGSGFVGSTSKTAGIGYAVGSGSTVTQATSRTTGVTINAITGGITLVSAAGSASYQSFTVTNSSVAAIDVIIVNQKTGADLYNISVTNIVNGSFRISFATTGGTTVEQPVFNFAVIKGQTN